MDPPVPSVNTLTTLGATLFSTPSPVPKSADNPGAYTLVARPDVPSAHAQQLALLSDALAVLCVPRPGAENKSALCIRVLASGVEVYVAGNKGVEVSDEVVGHIRGIFECLGDVSRRACEVRGAPAREADARRLRAAIAEPLGVLMREVYGFAAEKFRARLEGGWDAFEGFAKEVKGSVPLLVRRGMSMCVGKLISGMPGDAHFRALEDVYQILGLCRSGMMRGAEMVDAMEWAYHLVSTLADEYRLDDDGGTWVPANDIAYLVDQSGKSTPETHIPRTQTNMIISRPLPPPPLPPQSHRPHPRCRHPAHFRNLSPQQSLLRPPPAHHPDPTPPHSNRHNSLQNPLVLPPQVPPNNPLPPKTTQRLPHKVLKFTARPPHFRDGKTASPREKAHRT